MSRLLLKIYKVSAPATGFAAPNEITTKKRKKNENTDRREVQKNKRGPARFPKKRERLMAPHRRMRCGHLGRGDRIKRGGLNLQHRTSKAASFRKRAREETFIKSEHRTLRTRRHLHTAAPPNLV